MCVCVFCVSQYEVFVIFSVSARIRSIHASMPGSYADDGDLSETGDWKEKHVSD